MWQTTLQNPSFGAFDNLCGGKGIPVKSVGKIRPALDETVAHNGPTLVEIMTDAELI